MKTNKLILCVFGFALLFIVGAARAADAPKLTFKFTKKSVPGALQTIVAGINNEGVMVGQYQDKGKGFYHGYVLSGKKLTTLDVPNGHNTGATGINFNGAISVVGSYISSHGKSVGFRYTPRTKQFTDIPGPEGATSSYAKGVNDRGWIVGDYQDSSGVYHGFLLKGKKYTILDVPGAVVTSPNGINNEGNIALTWLDSNFAYKGALYNYKSRKYQPIDVPGAGPIGSQATCINNEGDITFWWWDSSRLVHGALCTKCASKKGRKFYKFVYPQAADTAADTYPNGINDNHAFVGNYDDSVNGFLLGFEATFKITNNNH
jgi:hypothetical protein